MLAVGSTVNLAARIQALAPAGGSLICDTTRGQVEWLADLGFDGERQIKGLNRPQKMWHLLALRDGATRFDVSLARGLSPFFGRAAGDADLVEVLPSRPEWDAPVWLVTHVDLHRTLKVQSFLNHLKAASQLWTNL